ncbi:MAG: T9SS type A sorting domain-containing protein [Mucilaginibacter sp.]
MKRLLLKPGFECIFALSLAAIIGLPPLVMGQPQPEKIVKKELEIKIKDGDTVVNDKNIKDLSAKERDEAFGDMTIESRAFIIQPRPDGKRHRIIIKRKGDDTEMKVEGQGVGPGDGEFQTFSFGDGSSFNDSLGNKLGLKLKMLRDMPPMAFNFKPDDDRFGREDMAFGDGPQGREIRIGRAIDNFSRPNSQSFNYTNTDDEGITTHVSYRVNDASKEKLSLVAGVEKAELPLKDINVSPEFSTGKTLLSFNLPAKTTSDVQLKDSQGKVLWSDKAVNGSFSKAFTLGLNGAYYLQVKQGSGIAVKRVVKED